MLVCCRRITRIIYWYRGVLDGLGIAFFGFALARCCLAICMPRPSVAKELIQNFAVWGLSHVEALEPLGTLTCKANLLAPLWQMVTFGGGGGQSGNRPRGLEAWIWSPKMPRVGCGLYMFQVGEDLSDNCSALDPC